MICDSCFLRDHRFCLCPDEFDYCCDYYPLNGPLTTAEIKSLVRLGYLHLVFPCASADEGGEKDES